MESAAMSAAERLSCIDVPERCRLLDLPPPDAVGQVHLKVLGRELVLAPPEYHAVMADSGTPAGPVDRLLALHYLLCDVPVRPAGKLISFRDLPGGQFYWEPFRSRTVDPLVRRIGNNIGLLRERLSGLEWSPEPLGDFGASIHGVGKLNLVLVYRTGDEEFPSSADILFDECIRHVYCTEDAAALAGRVCTEIIRR